MKTLKTLFLTVALAGVAHGQGILLNAGDTWTYQFTSLDYVSTQPGQMAPFGAMFSFSYTIESYPPNVLYECFEGLPPDGLLGSGTQPIGGNGIILPSNAWQDFAGSVRFTVTDGSFLIDSLTFTVWRPNASDPLSFDTYQTSVTPTPEPSPVALLVSGSSLLLLITRKWPNKSRGCVKTGGQ